MHNKLFEIASSQNGYFTSQQAIEAGYKTNNHSYHVDHNNWIREMRGIYRLAQFPHFDDEQYTIWSLWSTNRNGDVQGVFSHETALSIYDVSDIMPSKLHMTVPKDFRRSSIPDILVLHKAKLDLKEINQKKGYQVTTPVKTILDLAREGRMEDNILIQSINEFRSKGMIGKKDILGMIEESPSISKYIIS